MTKKDLVSYVAKKCGTTKAAASRAVESTFEAIAETLENEGEFSLIGFGKFSVKTTPAREGRNPQTGEALTIKESKRVTFKAGKALKTRVQ